MDKVFLQVINMSITASYAILCVLVIRLVLKRFPKIFSYMLWAVVLFRLICPFSFEGLFSLLPANEHVPQNIAYLPKPEINSGITSIDGAVNNLLPPANPVASVNPMQVWIAIGETVWIIGIVVLLTYSIYAAVKLHRNLRKATYIADNIYRMDKLKTSFVFGIIRPKIYLPADLSENESSYILLHEQTHIRRLDHIIKPVAFLVTCIHWFNPLVWISFFLMSEDMELSCDERVIRQMGIGIKKEYSSSLLSLSTGRRIVGGCPLAFGENNTKGRIKNVLNYKKPALWGIIIALLVVAAVIAGLMTNPKPKSEAVTWDLKPMIMVNGELYLDTGKEMPSEIDESAIIGKVVSSVDGTEKPTEDGQTNFGLVGAEYARFEDNIVVFMNNKWFLFEKEIIPDEVTINLNKKNDSTGMYEEVIVKTKDNEKTFAWENVINPTYAPVKIIADVDNDSKDEIIILLTTGYGTGVHVQEIHILNSEDLTERYIEDPVETINNTVASSITVNGDKVDMSIKWNGRTIEKSYDKSYAGSWFEKIAFGAIVNYEVVNNRIIAKVPGAMSPSEFPVTAVLEYDENLKVKNLEVEVETEETADNKNYDKIKAYLEEECKNVFSPYYELLGFEISDYQEEVVNGKVEAVFFYKVTHKNYDRDPDTVEYIKKAKESGDSNYQQLYDEYLQPKEMNFYFKAVIDENDEITLYYNSSPHGVEWEEVKMSDYIIK